MDALTTITLQNLPGFGRRTVHKIIDFISGKRLNSTQLEELLKDAGQHGIKLDLPTIKDIEKAFEKAEQIIENSGKTGIKISINGQEGFPASLRCIPDPPVVLYISGNCSILHEVKAAAVIGMRRPTRFGRELSAWFGERLAEAGYIVVSGLASGCDTAGHEGCLKAHGLTAAVVASGPDIIYPGANKDLADRIIESGGCIFSEYSPGENPQKYYFIERDRLQSGLSKAVILVETDAMGGAMHTARFCLEQGKMLACVVPPKRYKNPGKQSGNIKLLEEGNAFPIATKEDFIKLIEIIS